MSIKLRIREAYKNSRIGHVHKGLTGYFATKDQRKYFEAFLQEWLNSETMEPEDPTSMINKPNIWSSISQSINQSIDQPVEQISIEL